MTLHSKKTNPNHHNASRLGTFNQDLTRHLSYLNLQLKGFAGNSMSCAYLLEGDFQNSKFQELSVEDQGRIKALARRMRTLSAEVLDLSKDVAELNRDKTRIPGLKTTKVAYRFRPLD